MNTIAKSRPERTLARKSGSPTYFTGRPCINGHIAPRRTSDASCTACRYAMNRSNPESDRLRVAAYRVKKRSEDIEGYLQRGRESRRLEREKFPERVRERERKHGAVKRKRYPERKNAQTRQRQADQMQRTPKWVDRKEIVEFYEACPDGMEVDHVVPLRGKLVSGLHVRQNLQYLPREVNRLKGNRIDLDTFAKLEFLRLMDLHL